MKHSIFSVHVVLEWTKELVEECQGSLILDLFQTKLEPLLQSTNTQEVWALCMHPSFLCFACLLVGSLFNLC